MLPWMVLARILGFRALITRILPFLFLEAIQAKDSKAIKHHWTVDNHWRRWDGTQYTLPIYTAVNLPFTIIIIIHSPAPLHISGRQDDLHKHQLTVVIVCDQLQGSYRATSWPQNESQNLLLLSCSSSVSTTTSYDTYLKTFTANHRKLLLDT